MARTTDVAEPIVSPILGTGLQFLLQTLYLLGGISIFIGLFLPALHVESFWFFSSEVSILEGIRELANGGQVVLAWLILLLSVLLPLGKIIVGFTIASFAKQAGPILAALLSAFDFMGKWSLADVFVLAIIVIVADGQVLTAAQLGPGIYLFGGGVVLSSLATVMLHARFDRALGA